MCQPPVTRVGDEHALRRTRHGLLRDSVLTGGAFLWLTVLKKEVRCRDSARSLGRFTVDP